MGPESLIGLAVLAGTVMPLQALAAEPKSQGDQGSVGRIFERLQMTPQQRSLCVDIVKQSYSQNGDLRKQARDKWHDLLSTLRKPDVTLDEALAKQRELGRFQERLAEKRLVTWFAVRQILTPDQIARLSSLGLDGSMFLEEDHGEQRLPSPGRNDVP